MKTPAFTRERGSRSSLRPVELIRCGTAGDARLKELHDELRGYPGGMASPVSATDVVLPLRYLHGELELSFFSISAVIDTAADVTIDELAIESFYPANAATAAALASWASSGSSPPLRGR